MSEWSTSQLERIGSADELRLASYRPDGSLRPYVTIWAVRVGGGIFVRSAHGADNPWFVRATRAGTGRVRAGGVERDVAFERAEAADQAAIDAAYHAKYDRYGQRIVGSVMGAGVHGVTLRLTPTDQ